MTNFKIGDRVRCVDANVGLVDINTLKLNAEYIIQDIKSCSCGSIKLSVGAMSLSKTLGVICSNCHEGVLPPNSINYFFSSHRFVKVQEQTRVVRIQMEEKEPCLN